MLIMTDVPEVIKVCAGAAMYCSSIALIWKMMMEGDSIKQEIINDAWPDWFEGLGYAMRGESSRDALQRLEGVTLGPCLMSISDPLVKLEYVMGGMYIEEGDD